MQKIDKIYLHWTATEYSWRKPLHYHTIIDDKGVVYRLTDYHTSLEGHTFKRNENSVSLSLACMLNSDWKKYGPTEKQLDGMAKETAKICCGLGWKADEKFLEFRVMTHAEAAANRDYIRVLVQLYSNKRPSGPWDAFAQEAGLPHANYGPLYWHDNWPGGDSYRWDLWKLRATDKGGTGGYEMRKRIVKWMEKIYVGTPKTK